MRADEAGQAIIRAAASGGLAVAVLFADRPALAPVKPVALLLFAAFVLVTLQLVPLPSFWWALSGRRRLQDAATLPGTAQFWRPWSMVPGETVDALASLIVPLAALYCHPNCARPARERVRAPSYPSW